MRLKKIWLVIRPDWETEPRWSRHPSTLAHWGPLLEVRVKRNSAVEATEYGVATLSVRHPRRKADDRQLELPLSSGIVPETAEVRSITRGRRTRRRLEVSALYRPAPGEIAHWGARTGRTRTARVYDTDTATGLPAVLHLTAPEVKSPDGDRSIVLPAAFDPTYRLSRSLLEVIRRGLDSRVSQAALADMTGVPEKTIGRVARDHEARLRDTPITVSSSYGIAIDGRGLKSATKKSVVVILVNDLLTRQLFVADLVLLPAPPAGLKGRQRNKKAANDNKKSGSDAFEGEAKRCIARSLKGLIERIGNPPLWFASDQGAAEMAGIAAARDWASEKYGRRPFHLLDEWHFVRLIRETVANCARSLVNRLQKAVPGRPISDMERVALGGLKRLTSMQPKSIHHLYGSFSAIPDIGDPLLEDLRQLVSIVAEYARGGSHVSFECDLRKLGLVVRNRKKKNSYLKERVDRILESSTLLADRRRVAWSLCKIDKKVDRGSLGTECAESYNRLLKQEWLRNPKVEFNSFRRRMLAYYGHAARALRTARNSKTPWVLGPASEASCGPQLCPQQRELLIRT